MNLLKKGSFDLRTTRKYSFDPYYRKAEEVLLSHFSCFFDRYALANILLIIGAKRETPMMVLVWLVATVGFLIWSFVLVAIMFAWDTTSRFVGGIAMAQLINFAICSRY